jgi:tetratricopeptide (TPR) repeat protein
MRLLLLTFLAAGCGTAVPVAVPPELVVPRGTGDSDQAVSTARRLLEEGQPRQALELVNSVLGGFGEHVDAQRLRQDILRRRGRLGLLLRESEEDLQKQPDDPVALYLLGRIVPSFIQKVDLFAQVARISPDLFWGWLGLAYALRASDPARSLEVYGQLYEASGRHLLAAVAYAAALRQLGMNEVALEVYGGLREGTDAPGVGDLGVAETYVAENEPGKAWQPLLSSLRRRPFDPGVKQLVGDMLGRGVSKEQLSQLLDVLVQNPERLEQFGRDGGERLLASLFLQAGRPQAARSVLERDGKSRQEEVETRRMWRQLLLETGDLSEFLRVLREDFPEEFLEDETNQVRGLWLQLLDGPWAGSRDPLSTVEMSVTLVRVLLDAGLIREADIVASMASHRHRDNELARLQDEVRRVAAFEGRLKRLLYGGYLVGDEGPDLAAVLEELRRISVEDLGEDVVGEPEVFHVPLVGDLLNPFSEGLGTWFARYNRHLILGQRAGRPVEGMLLTRLSVRDLEPMDQLPLPTRCLEVVGEDRDIRTLSGVGGGDLAGVALLNHYVVDMDQVRTWAANLQDRRRIAAEDDHALLADPLPNRVQPLDPVDAHWRLTVLAPVADEDLVAAVLDMIRWHERAHLVDSFYYLPVEGNLFRNLGLLLGNGFSAMAIEAEMEARAEAAALALSPHTHLVLAHIAHFLEPQDSGSPHALGFRRLAERLIEGLEEDGVAPERTQVSRWHLLEEGWIRRVGDRLFSQQW